MQATSPSNFIIFDINEKVLGRWTTIFAMSIENCHVRVTYLIFVLPFTLSGSSDASKVIA